MKQTLVYGDGYTRHKFGLKKILDNNGFSNEQVTDLDPDVIFSRLGRIQWQCAGVEPVQVNGNERRMTFNFERVPKPKCVKTLVLEYYDGRLVCLINNGAKDSNTSGEPERTYNNLVNQNWVCISRVTVKRNEHTTYETLFFISQVKTYLQQID